MYCLVVYDLPHPRRALEFPFSCTTLLDSARIQCADKTCAASTAALGIDENGNDIPRT